jgi:DNA mismatch repair ATPase MutS
MRPLLLFPDRAFDPDRTPPSNEAALMRDLDLQTVLDAMAGGDAFLSGVARQALLQSLTDPEVIRYRQDACRDCIDNPAIVGELYRIAVEAIDREDRQLRFRPDYSVGLLNRSRAVLEIFMVMLRELVRIADIHAAKFKSRAFNTLFATLRRELNDEFFDEAAGRLERFKPGGSFLLSASLGPGNRGIGYTLRLAEEEKAQSWLERMFARKEDDDAITIADRDEAGARALSDLRDQGVGLLAAALAGWAERILGFFKELRTELAFYLGCLNLLGKLSAKGEATSFPIPLAMGERGSASRGLYDPSMALRLETGMMPNDFPAADARLVVITGANRGGKSAFLRSIGLSQLMMQAGMFVPAASFSAGLRRSVFTHFRREEDAAMNSGKFDEELRRMSDIVDRLGSDSLLLFNESFAATNEREGSEIAGQIVRALLAGGVQIFFVTHLYEFVRSLYDEGNPAFRFLIAERRMDGERTYRMVEGVPAGTSFGRDLYERVFGPGDAPDPSAGAGKTTPDDP